MLLLVGSVHAQSAPAQPDDTPSSPARQSIADILKAKSQRTPAQRKLSSQLLDAARQADGAARQPLPSADGQTRQAQPAEGRDTVVTVDIRADVTDAVLDRIRALGGTVVGSVPEYRAIRARLPLSALETLAELDAVSSIRPAEYPILHRMPDRDAVAQAVVRASGNTNTEGDVAHQADAARLLYRVNGAGIGIGVISDGVGTITAQQASGDLPQTVTVLPGQAGKQFDVLCSSEKSSGVEGAAMLEIVHDLAPGSDLFFATADSGAGEASMAKNIKDLCAAGADVIVDDIGWLLAPVFQDGVIAQAISEVVADGCAYFSSAGNGGNKNDHTSRVYEGDFKAGPALALSGVPTGATVHDFGGGVVGNTLTRTIGSDRVPVYASVIVLNWADANGTSANDYDLFLVDKNNTVLASATTTQDGDDEPIEYIQRCRDDTDARLVIVKNAGAADRYLRLNLWGSRLVLANATAGRTFGHAASQDAVGVAAVRAVRAVNRQWRPIGVFTGTESVEPFSSDGPRRIFYEADGTPITAGNFSSTGGKVVQKPDLTAADGVSTATPGFRHFFGTSAAAPHAAAIAALMRQAGGGPARVTPKALRDAMTESALDIEAPGTDRDSGAGIVMAPAAIRALTVSGNPPQPLAPGSPAGTIDLDTEFSDLTGTKTYELLSSDSAPVTPSLTGSTLSLTPKAPGYVEVVVRATSGQVKVTRTIPVTVQVGSTDYDTDDDGLIEIASLAQLDAVRYDLNADGAADSPTSRQTYYAAFTAAAWGMGCPKRQCTGYELTTDLDFDTDSSGAADAGDTYWNAGKGWAPIGGGVSGGAVIGFTGTFEGDGHTVANLFINRPGKPRIGLFGAASGELRNVGLVDVTVTGGDWVGGLVGHHTDVEPIERCHASGAVTGQTNVGGLAGQTSAPVGDSYATVRVSATGTNVGGLVGRQAASHIATSYATGAVTGQTNVGGLVGSTLGGVSYSYATGTVSGSQAVGGLVGRTQDYVDASYATGAVSDGRAVGGLVGSVERNSFGTLPEIRSSYQNLETSGIAVGVGAPRTAGGESRTTAALQSPTSATGIYQQWQFEFDLSQHGFTWLYDPWDFGTATQYPALAIERYSQPQVPWHEVGYQLRAGPSLTVTTDQTEATLRWDAVDVSPWSPPPAVTYTIYRADNPDLTTPLATALSGTSYVDDTVSAGTAYAYQVVAVVNGGEAVRSRWVAVIAGTPNRPPAFSDGSQTTRSVVENARPGVAFGRPVTAIDPDNDLLLYSLGGPDAAAFDINILTGQLLTRAALDYNQRNRYEVSVTVNDGKAGPVTITVIITITEFVPPPPPRQPPSTGGGRGTGGGSGGGSGGGGGRDSPDLHGNTPARATRIQVGGTAPWATSTAGRIDPAADVDYFAFSLPQAGVLVVETTGRTDTSGTAWQAGEELASASDGGTERNFRLSLRVAAGPVVVAVAGNGSRTGAYTLEALLVVGFLENPGPGAFQSGLGLLSGWVCDAEMVELEINGGARLAAAYGTERADTAAACGDSDNGFGLLFNWNLLGDGTQTVAALADGVAFAQTTFTVTTLGEEVVRNVTAETILEDFPSTGEAVRLVWQEANQNFVLAPLAGALPPPSPPGPQDGPLGTLENPGPASFQSGLGLLSGWVCEAEMVELEINGGARLAAAYGTERADTAAACGDSDNGFGLLFNWNLLGDGPHTVRALANGEEFGRATFTVTTLGEETVENVTGETVVADFPTPGEAARLVWQPATQNFMLAPLARDTAAGSGQ